MRPCNDSGLLQTKNLTVRKKWKNGAEIGNQVDAGISLEMERDPG